MKRFKLFIILLLILIIGIITLLIWWNSSIGPVSNSAKTTRYIVEKGKTGSQVASQLYANGLIKSPLAFKLYIRLTGKVNAIQAGEFELSPNLTMLQVLDRLGKGPLQILITIPEGLRREEIANKFVDGLEFDKAKGEVFRQDFLKASVELEGKLFPDTYLFPRDVSGQTVVKRMNDLFIKKTDNLKKNSLSSSLTENQIITLASMIERETKGVEEKSVVAGIIVNRIKIGMPLQIDATVQYAVATVNCSRSTVHCSDWWPVLSLDNLKMESPYNTYTHTSLPPAPIANPGLASLEAAFSPEVTDYLFYIHSNDGVIHYAKTLTEHNENIRKYLRQ